MQAHTCTFTHTHYPPGHPSPRSPTPYPHPYPHPTWAPASSGAPWSSPQQGDPLRSAEQRLTSTPFAPLLKAIGGSHSTLHPRAGPSALSTLASLCRKHARCHVQRKRKRGGGKGGGAEGGDADAVEAEREQSRRQWAGSEWSLETSVLPWVWQETWVTSEPPPHHPGSLTPTRGPWQSPGYRPD